MYQNIINFLLGKKKTKLSQEEAEDFLKLLAVSFGLEEEWKERTDDKSLLKKIIDEVDTEEEEDFGEALDVIFDFEEGSEEDEWSNEDERPLAKRRINRGEVFKKSKDEEGEKNGKNTVEDKNVEEDRPTENDNTLGDKMSQDEEEPAGGFTLPPSNTTFTLPPPSTPPNTTFNLPPSNTTTIEENEFPFELEPLKPVNNTGPAFKFYDEDGKEL